MRPFSAMPSRLTLKPHSRARCLSVSRFALRHRPAAEYAVAQGQRTVAVALIVRRLDVGHLGVACMLLSQKTAPDWRNGSAGFPLVAHHAPRCCQNRDRNGANETRHHFAAKEVLRHRHFLQQGDTWRLPAAATSADRLR
jgi:hypothetical protein